MVYPKHLMKHIAALLAIIVVVASVAVYKSKNQDASLADVKSAMQTEVSAAAVDYYLKIDGIEGESTDDQHKNELELLSFGWSKDGPGILQAIAQSSGGGRGAGKTQFFDVFFNAMVSKATPKLLLAAASGQHIPSATLSVRKSGGDHNQQDFLIVKFSDIMVSSYQIGGSSGEVPTDQFSINFAKVEFEYRAQKPDGTLDAPVKGGWDVQTNKKI